jgi:uncharacterized membrane protein YgdD (TMEM256/DUF423 family)
MICPSHNLLFFAIMPEIQKKELSAARIAILVGALLGGVGVALGAFGAHGLKDILGTGQALGWWKTAVEYQFVHALALLALGAWMQSGGRGSRIATICWTGGIIIFSGTLYAMALGAPRWLGAITPIGGTALIAGWVIFAIAAWRKPSSGNR